MGSAYATMRGLLRRFGARSARDTGSAPLEILAAANRARDEGRWADAADLYGRHAALRPRRVGSRIQLGNMRRRAGDLDGAEAAFGAALAIRPTVEAWAQLGHLLLTRGRTAAAVEAFQSALALVPGSSQAIEGMIAAGARASLPAGVVSDGESLVRLRAVVDDIAAAVHSIADTSVTPIEFYDAFRGRLQLEAPPGDPEGEVQIIIDARGAAPDRLRATMLSLLDQTHTSWTALIVADAGQHDHPVASIAASDSRLRLVRDVEVAALQTDMGLTASAGVVLEPLAIAWLVFAARLTGVGLVYADHDHHRNAWPEGPRYLDPAFQPVPDPDDMATTPQPPALAFWQGQRWTEAKAGPGSAFQALPGRNAMLAAVAAGDAAHLPLLLCSVARLSATAASGLPSPAESAAGYLEAVPSPPLPRGLPTEGDEPIRVIIPTRDEVDMLSACVDSLFSRASRPGRVHVTIADNRSGDARTAAFLADGVASGRFSVLTVDEAFNWSRINNLAIEGSTEPYVLLLNNDTEMLTAGWDERLCTQLARTDVGVVGARLLYPDGGLQHGGVVLGLGPGSPRHEGVRARGTQGPLNRWSRRRSVAAVTGAFLAVRRETHQAIGGFDEARLAIGYNDIDYCLRCRELGRRVVYAGDIELLHHESRTRGLNDTRGRIAWDVGELMTMRSRWGAALTHDPAVNPHWATVSSHPFDGVRSVSRAEAIAWLEASARAFPWSVARVASRSATGGGSRSAAAAQNDGTR